MINQYLHTLLDWSEAWSVLIPLAILFRHQNQPSYFKPVIIYLWFALVINSVVDVISYYYDDLPTFLQSNTPLYNIHSVVRFICFAAFFTALKQPHYKQVKKLIPWISLVFLLVNFGLNENFFNTDNISGNLLSFEAYMLLVYCLLYYLSQLQSEVDVFTSGADFWIVTGLCIYVVINFFVFLFYVPMFSENSSLAGDIWNVHNVAYLLLNVFIAKAFYVSPRLEYRA